MLETARSLLYKDMAEVVECHSGYAYGERPTSLYWQDQRQEVASILARWRTPAGQCFRVQTENGRIFELCYDEYHEQWNIQAISESIEEIP